ncbi:pyrroline-5-carboxylate reductase [Mesobacillus foraminis]|uniref:Pyrroline-5-carboxylate reductase n=1 Tax=Mesobacillus foraminis TaxID=279826 RepID=A0A4R2BJ33_9BACI|nr:pyrroline-5-carboxylate reductase [Mesobacillus foraminis]TCN25984.1 pyrroline-5-carboxylate reductase [Mesobacillus foraminis]
MLKTKKIAFLGAGSMAEAMIAGIVDSGLISPSQVIVTNKSNSQRLDELKRKYGIKGLHRNDIPFDEMDLIILAMKPKDAENVLTSLKHELNQDHLILSVLAGISTSFMENHLPSGQQVIRVMPNTSSMIGESATAMSPGTHTTQNNTKLAKELLECIGKVFMITEDQMDIFTGLAGSGPAYFYYLMEHMEQAGVEGSLDMETTREIIAQTVLGAARMIMEQYEDPGVLRENVTSPNGTTAAGLDALSRNGGGKAIAAAVLSAAKRSREISSDLEKGQSSKLQTV